MTPSSKKREAYGLLWDESYDDLAIELEMIRRGGGKLGLFEHFMRARSIAWPERYRHRWTELIYHEILKNIVTILMGPGSCQKTSHASEFVLLDYWAHPDDTIVLVSTTTVDKLDLAVFGEIKMLFNSARHRFPWLTGNVIESKRAISTDCLDVNDARDIRKGLIGRACYVGRQYVGLGVFAGIKQQRIRFLADELQFMAATFFDCLPNMFQSAGLDASGDPEVKVIGSGNPKHDPYDQLSLAAEPKDGWQSVADIQKTTCWDTKFHRGRCVNLIGLDSPNHDVPEGEKPPYPRLINRSSIKLVAARWGTDSMQYYSQCVGKMVLGMVGRRVLTKTLCEKHGAFDRAVWLNNNITRIGFLDPAWGGVDADRCIWGWLEFGTEITGMQIIRFGESMEVPIIMNVKKEADDQIAEFVERQSRALGIDPNNIFYGSTGKGTTGAALARVFGRDVPVPLAEGDVATDRPIRSDWYVTDEKTGERRLKRCNEEYWLFNTEMWFSVRNVVECGQMREMEEATVREFEMREYQTTRTGKTQLENKDDTRERMGESPDKADGFSFGVEGARQRGFVIGRLGASVMEKQGEEDFFDTEASEYEQAIKDALLVHGKAA